MEEEEMKAAYKPHQEKKKMQVTPGREGWVMRAVVQVVTSPSSCSQAADGLCGIGGGAVRK